MEKNKDGKKKKHLKNILNTTLHGLIHFLTVMFERIMEKISEN